MKIIDENFNLNTHIINSFVLYSFNNLTKKKKGNNIHGDSPPTAPLSESDEEYDHSDDEAAHVVCLFYFCLLLHTITRNSKNNIKKI